MSDRSDIPGAAGGALTPSVQGPASPERLRWEQERELTIEFFRLVNASDSIQHLIDAAVKFFQQHSQCHAVAIRLRHGADYPYFHALGFSEEFLRRENNLSSRDCFGELIPGGNGSPNLQCRCGDVISGGFDPSQPFFTPHGSFWTNDATGQPQAFRTGIQRSTCCGLGYQSIALIALNTGKDRIGLLQLNDQRKAQFTRQNILFWESLADHLAVALARFLAEETLRTNAEHLRALFGGVSDALAVHEIAPDGTTGRFLEVNDVICRRLGFSREEMLSMSARDIEDPAAGISAATISARLATSESVIFERIHRAKDGTRIPVEIHARRFVLRGRPAVITLVRDISERKRNEQALRESEQRLMQAVNIARLGIIEHDHDSGVTHASPTFHEICGLDSHSPVTPKQLLAPVLPEEREPLLAALRHSLDPGGDGLLQREHRILHPQGIRWIFVRAQTFFAGEGAARHPVRTVGAIVDITARKQAELELNASRQQLNTALNAAKLGIWSRDLETGVIHGDAVTNSIFAWADGEPTTIESLRRRIVAEDRELFLEHRAQVEKSEISLSSEYRIHVPGGAIRWISVAGNIVRDSSGKPTLLTGVVQDITDRKRSEEQIKALEEQFRHAQKMEAVGRLAGGIAHDFNNLLMVIRSYTEILEEDLSPLNVSRRHTQAILNATDRAASLTLQMLAFSRKQMLSPVPLNLNDAVAESAKMLQRLIGEDIELRVKPGPSLWTVRVDPNQIAQVIVNLCVNSRDAMPGGGILTLETRNISVDSSLIECHPFMAPGNYAVLTVTDTGTGISKDVQERMFEPFFTTKSVGKGTGLGLSTVYGIVKQSGGYLLCDSEPGRGASFTLYLPSLFGDLSDGEQSSAESLLPSTETLLLVEDDDVLRESIRQFLANLGYNVLTAGSGQQALAIANQFKQPIHLMITDVVMPRVNGRELSQMLASIRPGIKTVFMSGYIEDAIVRHGVRVDGVAFLQKPFSLAVLARKLRELLGNQPPYSES